MVLYSVFKSGLDGAISDLPNLRSAKRFLPDNIYDAIEDFHQSNWAKQIFSEDVRERYADLKRASADRCPRALGTVVKPSEIQFHHEVYNQFLWNQF
jgi:glutamine synthetase